VVNLVEIRRCLPAHPSRPVRAAARIFHELTELSALAIPTVLAGVRHLPAGAGVLSSACALLGWLVDIGREVFLGCPAAGQRWPPGRTPTARVRSASPTCTQGPGLAVLLRRRQRDAIRIGRAIMQAQTGAIRPCPALNPKSRATTPGILGIVSREVKGPFDPARGCWRAPSQLGLHEYKPRVRHSLVRAGPQLHAIRSGCSPTTVGCGSARRRIRRAISSCWPTRPTRR